MVTKEKAQRYAGPSESSSLRSLFATLRSAVLPSVLRNVGWAARPAERTHSAFALFTLPCAGLYCSCRPVSVYSK